MSRRNLKIEFIPEESDIASYEPYLQQHHSVLSSAISKKENQHKNEVNGQNKPHLRLASLDKEQSLLIVPITTNTTSEE